MSLIAPQPGILHQYASGLTAFEFGNIQAPNVLLFVGGLTNGLMDVPYLENLSTAVTGISSQPADSWSCVQTLLTSSYLRWGTSSLGKDAQELGKAVEYLRSTRGGLRQKVVLMGHSTGCQDAMEYLTRLWHLAEFMPQMEVEGAILQAPVSDSESLAKNLGQEHVDQLLQEIETDYVKLGKEQDILPQKFRDVCGGYPITAYRFKSLFQRRQDDDYFSSYLNTTDLELTFGKVRRPILVLYGSKDEYALDNVDKQKLIESWQQATPMQFWSPLSKVLQGATHDVGFGSDAGAMDDLIRTVVSYLKGQTLAEK